MDCEIITIGDELVSGHRVDTNSAYIARQLTRLGINVKYKSSVGDSVPAIEECFRLALQRAKIIITTGGLGPTDDDITKKAIVKVFKRNLIFNEEILEDIKKQFAKRGLEMPAINQNQALLPQGATLFPNKYGSALGICITEKGRIFIALPGVPFEMKQIMTDEVAPYLKELDQDRALKIVSLKTFGIFESKLAEMITDNYKLKQNVKLAYLPSPSGIELRISAAAVNEDEANEAVQKTIREIETRVGRYIFGREDDTLEAVVGQLLIDNDRTLAVAESCTGGQLGMQITATPGSSKYFLGGIISYSNDVKIEQLKVDQDIIEKHGAVSKECAMAMAKGCRELFNSDYALSVTGIAGPDGGTEDKLVGLTYIGFSSIHDTFAKEFNFGSSRETNRTRAIYSALEIIRRNILDIE